MDCNREVSRFADVVSAACRIIYLTWFTPEEEPEWVGFLEREMFHVLVAIFISRLRHLKALRMVHSFVWLGGYPGRTVMYSLFSREPDSASIPSKFESLRLSKRKKIYMQLYRRQRNNIRLWMNKKKTGLWMSQKDKFCLRMNQGSMASKVVIAWVNLSFSFVYLPFVIYRSSCGTMQASRFSETNPNFPQLQILILARSMASAQAITSLFTQTQSLKSSIWE